MGVDIAFWSLAIIGIAAALSVVLQSNVFLAVLTPVFFMEKKE